MTKRLTLSFFLLLLAFSAAAQPFRLEPPLPTSATSVVLRVETTWRDGCIPRDAQVSRQGNVINAMWSVPRNTTCPAAITPWIDAVSLGVVEAGNYEVRVLVDDFDGIKTVTTLPLVVAEANPAFRSVPSFVSTAGGTIDLRSRNFCVSTPEGIRVLVDGVQVPINVDPCSIVVFMPAHAAGPVDITVHVRDAVYTVRNAVRYLDPKATPDEAVFERVLIPVLFSGPGAFGSEWVTDAEIRNFANARLDFFPEVMRPLTGINPIVKFPLTGMDSPKGLVLFVPRELSDSVVYGLRVRDLSREASDWGTEIRVVRERDTRRRGLLLANVPFDGRYRLNLRLYSIDGGPAQFFIHTADEPLVAGPIIQLQSACARPPCNSREPGYVSIDLRQAFPQVSGTKSVFIETPPDGRAYWGFVTVTNNTTQHVTTITPQ